MGSLLQTWGSGKKGCRTNVNLHQEFSSSLATEVYVRSVESLQDFSCNTNILPEYQILQISSLLLIAK